MRQRWKIPNETESFRLCKVLAHITYMYRASILCNQIHCTVILFINSSSLNQTSNVSTNLFKSYTSIGALHTKMCDYRKLSTIYSMFFPVLSWYPRDSLPTSVHTLGPRKSSTQVECQVNQQWERRSRYERAPRRRQNRPRKASWLSRRRQTSKLICKKYRQSLLYRWVPRHSQVVCFKRRFPEQCQLLTFPTIQRKRINVLATRTSKKKRTTSIEDGKVILNDGISEMTHVSKRECAFGVDVFKVIHTNY